MLGLGPSLERTGDVAGSGAGTSGGRSGLAGRAETERITGSTILLSILVTECTPSERRVAAGRMSRGRLLPLLLLPGARRSGELGELGRPGEPAAPADLGRLDRCACSPSP